MFRNLDDLVEAAIGLGPARIAVAAGQDPDVIESLQLAREMGLAEGVWPAPEGAATLAAYHKLRVSGFLGPETETVLMNTGSGFKYMDVAMPV